MINNKNWLGVLFTILILLGLTGVAYAQSGGGTLTLTDIPATLNGKHVVFFAYDDKVELIGALSYNLEKDTGTLPRIVNGRVSIPVWIVT